MHEDKEETQIAQVPDYKALADELEAAKSALDRRITQLFGKTNDFQKELDTLNDVHNKVVGLNRSLIR